MFGWLKKKYPAELLGHNLTAAMIDPGVCSKMAGMLRKCPVPDGVLISEIAFIRASGVRRAMQLTAPKAHQEAMKQALEKALSDSFDGAEEEGPPEVIRHYAGRPMLDVAREALALYGKQGDDPMLTSPMFCARVRAAAEMNYEMQDLLRKMVQVCSKTVAAYRLVA